jgi:hypothetical protein
MDGNYDLWRRLKTYRVFLVRHKDTKNVYAMKLMDPERTKSKNPVTSAVFFT